VGNLAALDLRSRFTSAVKVYQKVGSPMANQIAAVRVRSIPAWASAAGVSVWCGGAGLELPGYRTLAALQGASGDGSGTIHLVLVQPCSDKPVSGRLVRRLRAWSRSWLAEAQ